MRNLFWLRLENSNRYTIDREIISNRLKNSPFHLEFLIITEEISSDMIHLGVAIKIYNLNKNKSRTNKKELSNLFPEFPENEKKVEAVKGMGALAQKCLSSNFKIRFLSGNLEPEELIEYARAHKAKKAFNKKVSNKPESHMTKNRKKKKLDSCIKSEKRNFFIKLLTKFFFVPCYNLLSELLKIIFTALARTFFFWLLYIYFIHVIKIKSVGMEELLALESLEDFFNFLLGKGSPPVPHSGTPVPHSDANVPGDNQLTYFLLGILIIFYIIK